MVPFTLENVEEHVGANVNNYSKELKGSLEFAAQLLKGESHGGLAPALAPSPTFDSLISSSSATVDADTRRITFQTREFERRTNNATPPTPAISPLPYNEIDDEILSFGNSYRPKSYEIRILGAPLNFLIGEEEDDILMSVDEEDVSMDEEGDFEEETCLTLKQTSVDTGKVTLRTPSDYSPGRCSNAASSEFNLKRRGMWHKVWQSTSTFGTVEQQNRVVYWTVRKPKEQKLS